MNRIMDFCARRPVLAAIAILLFGNLPLLVAFAHSTYFRHWRQPIFFEGYLRGAAHANIYKHQTGLMAPLAWLTNAHRFGNTELSWPIVVVPGGPWDATWHQHPYITREGQAVPGLWAYCNQWHYGTNYSLLEWEQRTGLAFWDDTVTNTIVIRSNRFTAQPSGVAFDPSYRPSPTSPPPPKPNPEGHYRFGPKANNKKVY